jgi:hypothetical protein
MTHDITDAEKLAAVDEVLSATRFQLGQPILPSGVRDVLLHNVAVLEAIADDYRYGHDTPADGVALK